MATESILDGLNEVQQSAVTSPASVLQILAPPGSGKTKTLTARVAHLIAHDGINPRNIIVCTFTVKAAREMKQRIRGLLGDELAGQLILGTFHSICRRFLAKYGEKIGVNRHFGIADSSDTLSILTRIIKRLKSSLQPAQARSRISRLKSKCIAVEQALTSKRVEQKEFAQVYAEYQATLRTSNLLDYDDLLLRCAELLLAYPQCVSRIEAVLIDEFQDTNNVQFDLMGLFAQQRRTITIVGDPDQSIYGFRSAEIKNLKKMQNQFTDTLVINLEENYRSTGAILLLAMEIIEQDRCRPAKRIKPTHSLGTQPVLRKLPNSTAEAAWIVAEINRTVNLTGNLLKWSDFAVLLRSASLSRLVESALGKAGMPYRMVGGHRFFDRVEVKLVLDYLRVINQTDHNDAVARIVNVPSRKIGIETIQGLLEEADVKRIPIWSLILSICRGNTRPQTKISNQAQKGLELFTNLILTTRKKITGPATRQNPFSAFIEHVIQIVGIQDHLMRAKPEDFDSRWANVQELLAQASDQAMTTAMDEELGAEVSEAATSGESTSPMTIQQMLSRYLANIALSTEVQKSENDHSQEEQVTLSTIHAAKGLEWPVIFIPGAYEGSIPHSRAEDTDEERRLLYVAMTRAQSLLYISCPAKDSHYERTTLSQFLSQKPIACYLAERGPKISTDDVRELAMILRRECPHISHILDTRSSLDNLEDDLWLIGIAEHLQDEQDLDQYVANSLKPEMPLFKKRRMKNLAETACYNGTTSANEALITPEEIDRYSRPTGPFSADFVSAATAMQELRHKEPPKPMAPKPSAKRVEHYKDARRAQSGKHAAQSSLAVFFSKRSAVNDSAPEPTKTRKWHETHKIYHDEAPNVESPLRDISNITVPVEPIQRSPGHKTGHSILQSATTMHLTTINDCKRLQVHRRTLGMRRSLNGWTSRKSQQRAVVYGEDTTAMSSK